MSDYSRPSVPVTYSDQRKYATCMGSGTFRPDYSVVPNSARSHVVPTEDMVGASLWCKDCEQIFAFNLAMAQIEHQRKVLLAMGVSMSYTIKSGSIKGTFGYR